MDRKKFLFGGTLAAFSLSTFGYIFKNDQGEIVGDCNTTNDILGPFYRADSPLRSDLTFDGLKGNKINIKGMVYKHDCVTPLKDAQVEIWHCDIEGEYDNETKEFRHRGKQVTNDKGEYAFSTILPGKYLNGDLYRPSHIHFRVTEKNSKELISQIYFKGDPHITKDPWASADKAKLRILEVAPEDIHGNLTIKFDIYLTGK